MNIPQMVFRQEVVRCGNTGELIDLSEDLDRIIMGNIMADVAARFIDEGQDIKAMLILNERKRLGV